MEFCRKLSEKTGKEYNLPSEAQWEYACRAGTTTPFHFGKTITNKLARYHGSGWRTSTVGSYPPNAFGLYDMPGNVFEWCADKWHGSYDGAPTDGSAWTSEDSNSSYDYSEYHVQRGCSHSAPPEFCRSASRSLGHFSRTDVTLGFRVMCIA